MKTMISHSTAASIASSLPLMDSRRGEIEVALGRNLPRTGSGAPSDRQAAAAAILDMLLDHAGRISGKAEIARVDGHASRHRQLGIGAAHYSCFGDALGPVMKDVLGAKATPTLRAAWGDTYWAIARMVAAEPVALAA
jgi:hemoglobin-like flavoprotein